jgi:CHAT domain-containing protein
MKKTVTLVVWLIVSGCLAPALRADPLNPSERARELLELSKTQNVENHALAVQTAQEALALFQSANDSAGIAQTYAHLGRCYFAQDAMNEATQSYELALKIWRQQANVQEEAQVLINLGYIEAKKGEWLNGVSYLMQAQNLVDEQKDPEMMGRIASGMGFLFNESGLPESGLAQYQRAMEYFREAKITRNYNRMLLRIGYTHFVLKNYSAALSDLQQALVSFENSTDPTAKLDVAECHEHMGRVYIAIGQYQLALQHLAPVPAIYNSTDNRSDAAQAEALIGQVYEKQGLISRARASYLEASRVLREVSDRVNDAAVRFALGRLELNSGNYAAAENYLKESIENTEDIRRYLSARVFAAAFSASVHERYEAYIECLMRKHSLQRLQGSEVSAFEASELARARSLSELLRDTQTTLLNGVDPQLAQKEKTLRQAIRAKVDQTVALLATNYKKEELDKLEGSLTSLREQYKQLTAKLRQMNPDYDRLKEPSSYSLAQIQKFVVDDDQTVLLEYLLGRNASYVWVVTHNGIRVFELPKADVITDAVRRVYDNLSKEPGAETNDQLTKATAALREIVLAPVAAQLTAPRVIVVADGALNYIPFQLLPDAANNNEPLVAKYEVVNAPSASILGQLRQERQQRRPRSKVLAAFGDPVFASNYAQFKSSPSRELLASATAEPWQRAWRDVELESDTFDPSVIQPLAYSKYELKNLSDIAGPASFVATGFDASRQMLETTDLSKYAILHFATHGLLNPKTPELSGFFLSMVDTNGHEQNGFITMQDVYRLQAPVDLVVLSACRTGLGKDVRGEGLIGLTRGFMYAGASSVVASLWKVDDEATAELMKHFYENMLRKGMRPAEALRVAQNALRQDPQWQSPHFWAGFTLQGEFKEPIKLPATRTASLLVQKSVGGGLLMALLAAIGWGYWRRIQPQTGQNN